jgi:four helix bundle protein
MNSKELQHRSKKFALEIIKLTKQLPNNRVGWTFTDQVIRSATSVAANYRAVYRARSDKEFIAKMGMVIEEADETLFWIEMIDESGVIIDAIEHNDFGNSELRFRNKNIENRESENNNQKSKIDELKDEANQLVSIFVASAKTVKSRLNQQSKIINQKSGK